MAHETIKAKANNVMASSERHKITKEFTLNKYF